MKTKTPIFLFVVAIALLLFINVYKVEYGSSKSEELQMKILEKINYLKCASTTPCPKVVEKPCQVYDTVIKLPEMTEVLNKRDEKREAIFFTETSGAGVIKPRFICAIESAARAYPDGDIYLLIAYVPHELHTSVNEALFHVLKHYRNVQVLRVDLPTLFANTPLEDFYKSGKLMKSQYLAAHTSDVVRFLTIWLYGGKYFDLDVLTMKNLTGIDSFIIDESQLPNNYIANCCFGFKKHSPVGEFMFNMITNEFDGTEWANNGPRVLTDAMRWYTGADVAVDMNPSNLKEFIKLKYEQLFPIEYFDLLLYFNEAESESTMKKLKNVTNLLGMHIGNNLIHNEVVHVGSKQPYSLLAQRYCPRAYWSAYMIF